MLTPKQRQDYLAWNRDSCGMIGMGRVGERIGQKVNPFKHTPVYSAFLLNVKATVEKGALFPCKPIWEDVEFAYILRSVDLACLKTQRFSHSKSFSRTAGDLPVMQHLWDNTTRLAIGNDDPQAPSLAQLVQWYRNTYLAPEWSRKIIQLGIGLLDPEWKSLTLNGVLVEHEVSFPESGNHAIVIASTIYGNRKLWMITCMEVLVKAFKQSPVSVLHIVLVIPFWSLKFEPEDALSPWQWNREVLKLISNLPLDPTVICSVSTTAPIKDGVVSTSCRSTDGAAFVLSFKRGRSDITPTITGFNR